MARLCAERGIAHRTLVWSGAKPSTGLPAAAREARYRLLAEAAQAQGIGLILTGHTADDQAETVLMRHARDDGRELAEITGRGLAGMAPATLYDWRIWIVRPLLGVRREALREVLLREHVGWAEDPTNTDKRFERPRIRAALAEDKVGSALPRRWPWQAVPPPSASNLVTALPRLIGSFASRPAPGLVRLDPGFAASGDAPSCRLRLAHPAGRYRRRLLSAGPGPQRGAVRPAAGRAALRHIVADGGRYAAGRHLPAP